MRRLVEGVGVSSPVGEEQAKTNSLEHTGKGSHCNSVERTLLGEDLRDELYIKRLAVVFFS